MGLCALMQLSTVIMKIIPRCVKLATVVGMGLLIALIGMVSIRLVVPNTDVRAPPPFHVARCSLLSLLLPLTGPTPSPTTLCHSY
jgi:xanthine/uracil/vitamin C permease (AzgA family)